MPTAPSTRAQPRRRTRLPTTTGVDMPVNGAHPGPSAGSQRLTEARRNGDVSSPSPKPSCCQAMTSPPCWRDRGAARPRERRRGSARAVEGPAQDCEQLGLRGRLHHTTCAFDRDEIPVRRRRLVARVKEADVAVELRKRAQLLRIARGDRSLGCLRRRSARRARIAARRRTDDDKSREPTVHVGDNVTTTTHRRNRAPFKPELTSPREVRRRSGWSASADEVDVVAVELLAELVARHAAADGEQVRRSCCRARRR